MLVVIISQSADHLFHEILMVLCENEYFLRSNLLCSFTSVKLCPQVVLLSLIKKNIRLNNFIKKTIKSGWSNFRGDFFNEF